MLRKLTMLVAAFVVLSSTAALAESSRYERDDREMIISDQTVSVVNLPQPNVQQPVQAPEPAHIN